ncbi:hypothetical protein WS81_12870 [Burkholderia sp. MSMB2040]|uniref:Uncharacterized protein n=1 Tax=Burkholderia savannae TaxID=1637837 RepID=A0ABR5T587_9BURK|nr:hypothetical protein WS78_22945 [Burkholderia savannae]KVG80570.1 hypothetical protein WS81_12870 [Burkholderia sp. MSMB2040]KWZ38349.1 hypothetical protein WS72_26205 [Burkholderia savannae]
MTNTHERQKRAARPSEMFPPGGHSLSHAQGFGHRGFQRSRGKTFATAAGTCGARALRKSSEGKRMSMTIVGVGGARRTVQERGDRARAFAMAGRRRAARS